MRSPSVAARVRAPRGHRPSVVAVALAAFAVVASAPGAAVADLATLPPAAVWSPPEDATLAEELEILETVSYRLREQARHLRLAGALEHLPVAEVASTHDGLLARLALLAEIRASATTRALGLDSIASADEAGPAWDKVMAREAVLVERLAVLEAALADDSVGRGQVQDLARRVHRSARRLHGAHESLAKDLARRVPSVD